MIGCKEHKGMQASPVDPCHFCTEALADELLRRLPKCYCGAVGIWVEPGELYHEYVCDKHNYTNVNVKAQWINTAIKLDEHLDLSLERMTLGFKRIWK